MPFQLISLTPIVISSSHLRLGFQVFSFPHVSPPIPYMHLYSPSSLHMPRPRHPCFHQPDNICCRVQIFKLLIVQCLTFAYSRFPLRPKYPSQCPGLKHSKRTFLPQYVRPSRTPIQNSKVILLCILICIFLESKWEETIL